MKTNDDSAAEGLGFDEYYDGSQVQQLLGAVFLALREYPEALAEVRSAVAAELLGLGEDLAD
jgi:hypothetical protein